MFFVERLCGIAIYALTVFIFYILFDNKRLSNKQLYFFFAFVLSVMAVFYTPYKTSDLFRTYDMLQTISSFDFTTLTENILSVNSNPLIYVYYWLVSKTGCFWLLPGINCFVCYSLIFYIVSDMEKRYCLSTKSVAVVILFTMFVGNYMPVISGIKMMLALSMLIFAFYREFVMRKFNALSVVIYVFALFTHNIVSIILLLRLIVFLLFVKAKVVYKTIMVMGSVVAFALFMYFFPETMSGIFDSGMGYLTNDDLYYDVWECIIAALMCVFEIVLVIRVNTIIKLSGNRLKSFKQLNNFLALVLVLSVALCWIFTLFHRLVVEFGATLSIPLLLIYMENDKYIPHKRSRMLNFRSSVILFSLIIFAIAGSRGSMSALKFFEL